MIVMHSQHVDSDAKRIISIKNTPIYNMLFNDKDNWYLY